MSSIAQESSNPLAKEMTESEHVMVEIPRKQPVNDMITRITSEWVNCMKNESTKGYERERHMEKVPHSLLRSEKGLRNRKYYKPTVVSLGPYHHNQDGLEQAENMKYITLEEYGFNSGKSITCLYNKVFEVIHDARKCYIDGSTDAYNDEEFTRMMLRDGCFILCFIIAVSSGSNKLMIVNEYLGATELLNIMSDIFLLENQIPFVVLQVLLALRFPDDKGEEILYKFFSFLNYGVVIDKKDKKVLGDTQRPLHLLELYRSCFISLSTTLGSGSAYSSKLRKEEDSDDDSHEDYNYVARNRWFASATELKTKWIFLGECMNADMKFEFRGYYGEFEIARRAVSSYTKAIYLNMIAYEMCPHNPNDFRVSTYVRVMKALIIQDSDVKELRDKYILLHGLGRDEEVVKMFNEIEVPAVNLPMFNKIRREIVKLHYTNYKKWMAELITEYLNSPWKMLGVFVATAILVTSFVQTYFAIKPRGK